MAATTPHPPPERRDRDGGPRAGYLLVAIPFFLQRLEGPPNVLAQLIGSITKDHRHENLIIVEQRAVASRTYGAWGAALRSPAVRLGPHRRPN